jgi:bacterioferritin-associated ferredoxin
VALVVDAHWHTLRDARIATVEELFREIGWARLEFENGIQYPLTHRMYVCVCFAVTDKQVESAIDGGAKTVEEVTRACRAGGDCGSCHGMIETMIESACDRACAREEAPATTLVPPAALTRKTAA